MSDVRPVLTVRTVIRPVVLNKGPKGDPGDDGEDADTTALAAALAAEEAARIAADASEGGTRAAADSALSSAVSGEATTRGNADTAESAARIAADAVNAAAVAAEAVTRAAADTTLAGRATALEAVALTAGEKAAAAGSSGTPAGGNRFVTEQHLAAVIGTAPANLDTLQEIAAQLATDESAVTALIAVVAGKQAADADLTAIAALDSQADKLPYATGPQAWALTDFPAQARTLVAATTAALQRAALGLGLLAVKDTVAAGDIDATAVTTAKILDANVTNAKLANMADGTIKGRALAAGVGVPTDLTPLQVRTLAAVVPGTDVATQAQADALSNSVQLFLASSAI